MEKERDGDDTIYRQDFAQMPGVNGSLMGSSLRVFTPQDRTKRGVMWSSIGAVVIVVVPGVFFLRQWLNWF